MKFLAFTDRERHPIEMASALSLRNAVKPTVDSEFPNTAQLICPWPPRESTALTGAPGAEQMLQNMGRRESPIRICRIWRVVDRPRSAAATDYVKACVSAFWGKEASSKDRQLH